jgi:hypothetical protein
MTEKYVNQNRSYPRVETGTRWASRVWSRAPKAESESGAFMKNGKPSLCTKYQRWREGVPKEPESNAGSVRVHLWSSENQKGSFESLFPGYVQHTFSDIPQS